MNVHLPYLVNFQISSKTHFRIKSYEKICVYNVNSGTYGQFLYTERKNWYPARVPRAGPMGSLFIVGEYYSWKGPIILLVFNRLTLLLKSAKTSRGIANLGGYKRNYSQSHDPNFNCWPPTKCSHIFITLNQTNFSICRNYSWQKTCNQC